MDAFLCAAMGTKIDIAFQKKLGTGLFGSEGFSQAASESIGAEPVAETSTRGSTVARW